MGPLLLAAAEASGAEEEEEEGYDDAPLRVRVEAPEAAAAGVADAGLSAATRMRAAVATPNALRRASASAEEACISILGGTYEAATAAEAADDDDDEDEPAVVCGCGITTKLLARAAKKA